jgi:hypothetical protein
MPQVHSLEEDLHRSLLASLSLTADFEKQPVSSRATSRSNRSVTSRAASRVTNRAISRANSRATSRVTSRATSHVTSGANSRATKDLSTKKKKMEEGQAFFDKVCILTAHKLDMFLNAEYVVSPRLAL